jgi:hypothetical protein
VTAPVLIVPGIGNSGPDHWQSLWENANPSFVRVQQRDWNRPVCAEWVEELEAAVARRRGRPVLVAHSLGCLLVAHWAASAVSAVRAALLVAPPDPEGPTFPREAVGFSPLPMKPFAFPSAVVVSTNDPYGSLAFAERCAISWRSRLANIGPAGHINAKSGLGRWQEGLVILEQLLS